MDEQETARFIQFMRHQISKIPKDLSAEEYREKARRYRQLSKKIEGFESAIEKKKYQLLADKCEQFARQKEEAQHPVQAPSAVELINDSDDEQPRTKSNKSIKNLVIGSVLIIISLFFVTRYPLNFVLTQNVNYAIAIIIFILGLVHMFKKDCC